MTNEGDSNEDDSTTVNEQPQFARPNITSVTRKPSRDRTEETRAKKAEDITEEIEAIERAHKHKAIVRSLPLILVTFAIFIGSVAGLMVAFSAEHMSTSTFSFARLSASSGVFFAALPAITSIYFTHMWVRDARSRIKTYADIKDDNLRFLITQFATEELKVEKIFKEEIAEKQGGQ